MPLQDYDDIRLKEEFRGTLGDRNAIKEHRNRTPGKDEVAQYVVENVIQENRWPVYMVDLGEETGYSRQHCANVISEYFEGVDDTENNTIDLPDGAETEQPTPNDLQSERVFVEINGSYQQVYIDIPGDVENADSYVRGYLDGKRD